MKKSLQTFCLMKVFWKKSLKLFTSMNCIVQSILSFFQKNPLLLFAFQKNRILLAKSQKTVFYSDFLKEIHRFYVIGNSTLSKKNGVIKKKSNGFHSVKDRESSLALTENGDLEQNLRNNGLNLTKASKNCSF